MTFSYINEIEISNQNMDLVFATIGDGYMISTDGGFTWPSIDSLIQGSTNKFVEFPLISVNPYDDSQMFGVNNENKLLKTNDRGESYLIVSNETWTSNNTDIHYDINGLYIYAITKSENEYKLKISNDQGELNSWSNLISSSSKIIFCIDDSSSGELYYAAGKTVYQSLDYGNYFEPIYEFDFKVTGLYKKPKTNRLFISTYYKIYELNLETEELTIIRTIDNFNPAQFYPLKVGNTWIYRTNGWDSSPNNTFDYEYRKVVRRDTTLDNGQKYFVIEEQSEKYFERYDSTETKVWMYYKFFEANENQEFLSYDLTTVRGDVFKALFSDYFFDISLDFEHVNDSYKHIFNENRHLKYFETYNYGVVLAKGLGIIEKDEGWDYGVRKTTLKGCVIDGIAYGDTSLVVSVENEEDLQTKFSLSQNYPNPFNPTTRIKYQVASIENVSLKVYDSLGREIKTLINKPMQPGEYEVEFDATGLPSGVYFYRLSSGSFSQTRKMLLIK